jgi:hypothetical protein
MQVPAVLEMAAIAVAAAVGILAPAAATAKLGISVRQRSLWTYKARVA